MVILSYSLSFIIKNLTEIWLTEFRLCCRAVCLLQAA